MNFTDSGYYYKKGKRAPRESPHKAIPSFSLSHSDENVEYNSLYVADFPSNISDKL